MRCIQGPAVFFNVFWSKKKVNICVPDFNLELDTFKIEKKVWREFTGDYVLIW